MKKTIKKMILLIFISAMVMILRMTDVEASSVSLSANTQLPQQGQTVTVTANVTSGAWNLKLEGAGKSETIYGYTNSNANASASKSISFIAGQAGTTYTITLTGDMTDINSKDAENVSKSINITVAKASANNNTNNSGENQNTNTGSTTEKSNVATLANLGITPNDFSGFKANTFNYNVEVPNEVESIEVYAKKGQNGQKISGLGTKKLNEGQNKIEVIVTAEDGKTKKTYTINVIRKAKDEAQPENQQEEQNEDQPMEEIFGLSELKIEGYELDPQFQTDIYEYRVDLKEDLEKLDITTLATEANSTVEVTGNENLVDGENIITITVKGENEEKIATYQIIVNKILSTTKNDTNLETDHKQMISQIVIISAILVIAFVILIIIIVKIKKTKNLDGYIPYENILENNNEENDTKKNDEDETIKEEIKRKKHSKGKRFK